MKQLLEIYSAYQYTVLEFRCVFCSPRGMVLLWPIRMCTNSFHLISCYIIWNHTSKCVRIANQLDYLRIVVLMWGPCIPSVYYSLYCDVELRLTYCACVRNHSRWMLRSPEEACYLCSFSVCHLHMQFTFPFPPYRRRRSTMYACLGLCGITFTVHGLFLQVRDEQWRRMAM